MSRLCDNCDSLGLSCDKKRTLFSKHGGAGVDDFRHRSLMKWKPSLKKRATKDAARRKRQSRKPSLPPIVEFRRGPFEFPDGIDDTRALLVEESIDERERRG
jgi:hypothetical protein